MTDLFSVGYASEDWGLFLVDALNAYNSLNQAALLWNA